MSSDQLSGSLGSPRCPDCSGRERAVVCDVISCLVVFWAVRVAVAEIVFLVVVCAAVEGVGLVRVDLLASWAVAVVHVTVTVDVLFALSLYVAAMVCLVNVLARGGVGCHGGGSRSSGKCDCGGASGNVVGTCCGYRVRCWNRCHCHSQCRDFAFSQAWGGVLSYGDFVGELPS